MPELRRVDSTVVGSMWFLWSMVQITRKSRLDERDGFTRSCKKIGNKCLLLDVKRMIEKSECPNCSASVDPGSDRCSFCGQWFAKKSPAGKIVETPAKIPMKAIETSAKPSYSFDTGSRVVGYYTGPTSILGKPGKTILRQN